MPCDPRNETCANQAAWHWRHCCQERNLCQKHHEHRLKLHEARYFPGRPWTCSDCKRFPMPDPKYHPI